MVSCHSLYVAELLVDVLPHGCGDVGYDARMLRLQPSSLDQHLGPDLLGQLLDGAQLLLELL